MMLCHDFQDFNARVRRMTDDFQDFTVVNPLGRIANNLGFDNRMINESFSVFGFDSEQIIVMTLFNKDGALIIFADNDFESPF